MDLNSLISVIVPVYNVAEYLPRCLDSILAQTHTNIEVIAVNDGSTDDSGSICDKYAEIDSRVKVIHQQNGGVSAARNAGLNAACGAWIAFVDADDWIEPDMYELMFAAALREDVKIVSCGYADHWFEGDTYLRMPPKPQPVLSRLTALEHIIRRNLFSLSLWNKLYWREQVADLRFDNTIHYGEDLLFAVKYICLSEGDMACVDKAIYHYCRRKCSATAPITEKAITHIDAMEKCAVCVAKVSTQLGKLARTAVFTTSIQLFVDFCKTGQVELSQVVAKKIRQYLLRYLLSSGANLENKCRNSLFVLFPKLGYRILTRKRR